jgi:hypothetical protein
VACVGKEAIEKEILPISSYQALLLHEWEIPNPQEEEKQHSELFHPRGFYGPNDRRWVVVPVSVNDKIQYKLNFLF